MVTVEIGPLKVGQVCKWCVQAGYGAARILQRVLGPGRPG